MNSNSFRTAILLILLMGPLFPFAFAERIQYHSADRRDPFVPLVGPGGIKMNPINTSLQLEGIIFDPKGGSLVLINGEYFKEGAKIESSSIEKIYKDRVILKREDEEKILWLREDETGEKAL